MKPCDFCDNKAVYKATAAMGAPLYCCEDCKELGPIYVLTELEK